MKTIAEAVKRYPPGGVVMVSLSRPSGIRVPMRVVDYRTAYGSVQVLLQPVHGEGEGWVEVTSLEDEQA